MILPCVGGHDDESGAALIMSVVVMLILSTLSTAVLVRTLSVLNFVRAGQDYDAALAAADAGVADALFKIDQNAPASWTTPGNTGSNGSFEYWATKISDSEYVVSSAGKVGNSKHGVQVRVVRTAQFPYALFSNGPLHLDGAASAGNVKVAFSALVGSGDVRVGSNSTVVCNGTLPSNVLIDWFQTQSECPTTRVTKLEKKRDLTIRQPPRPTTYTGTPLNWENCPFTSGVIGALPALDTSPAVETTVAGGTYVCRRDVTMLGTIRPSATGDPVKLYILPRYSETDGVTIVDDYQLDISAAVVNPDLSGTRFQIYKVGDEPIIHNESATVPFTFRGVMFAPETAMTINGGQLSWAGSINLGQLKVNGAPNLKIGYDFDLATYLGPDWRVSRYREIPSAEAKFFVP